jgi:hypothetical protein
LSLHPERLRGGPHRTPNRREQIHAAQSATVANWLHVAHIPAPCLTGLMPLLHSPYSSWHREGLPSAQVEGLEVAHPRVPAQSSRPLRVSLLWVRLFWWHTHPLGRGRGLLKWRGGRRLRAWLSALRGVGGRRGPALWRMHRAGGRPEARALLVGLTGVRALVHDGRRRLEALQTGRIN